MRAPKSCARICVLAGLVSVASIAHADDPTPAPVAAPPGFLEPIVHWGVQKGETCEDIAKVMYGSAAHVPLIGRYNRVVCAAGRALPEGTTLILPKTVTSVPDARVKSSHPDVRGRPSGGSWATVATGASLYRNHNVQTLDDGRAHIEFLDHTHVFLAANTLVVIYGTAEKTRVSKAPPTIELKEGEVQAGLSALRGEPALVALPEGGTVNAASRDTVIERKASRTTVAVFEGKAAVASGGKTVDVPKDFGTRFTGALPPAPPRPLPPAPRWEAGGSLAIVLAPPGSAVISTSWAAVDKAKAYRLEVSRDEAFHDLVVREEVPADVRSFRAEKMPVGRYHVRVRAIDLEEYLGIASDVRRFEVVAGDLRGAEGGFDGTRLRANPYGMLALSTDGAVEVSLDDGPFGKPPTEIDLLRQSPQQMRFRTEVGTVETFPVEYTSVAAEPSASFDPAKRVFSVRVAMKGVEGIDVVARVAPRLRVRLAGRVESVPLAPSADHSFVGTIDPGEARGSLQIDVLDGRGRLLGGSSVPIPEKPAPKPAPPAAFKLVGLRLPPMRPSGVTGMPWWSPTAPLAFGVGLGGGATAAGPVLQGNVRVSGALGPVGLDALVETSPLEPASDSTTSAFSPHENMAWLGVRYRAFRKGDAALEVAPALRLGLPLVLRGQSTRLDAGIAVGGASGRGTWLLNAGAQLRLTGAEGSFPVVQPYIVGGGTYDVMKWLRAYAAVDLHVLATLGDGEVVVPYGVSLGFEAGRVFFVSLGGWVGRAESVEAKIAGTGSLSLGWHIDMERP